MSRAGQVSTQTIVAVMVEVLTGVYGASASIGEVNKQAAEEGVAKVRNILAGKGRVIGEPTVRQVTILEDTP